MIPERFDDEGLLPPGDYTATLQELRDSILVKGPLPRPPGWNAVRRAKLVDNLEVLVKQLWQVGIQRIFVNGSFAEEKDSPRDIDGYFECEAHDYFNRRLQKRLNEIDPHQEWTWDYEKRVAVPDHEKKQLPMWVRYHVELYPDYGFALSGVKGPDGLEMPLSQLFRLRRDDFRPKGIIQRISAA